MVLPTDNLLPKMDDVCFASQPRKAPVPRDCAARTVAGCLQSGQRSVPRIPSSVSGAPDSLACEFTNLITRSDEVENLTRKHGCPLLFG